MKVNNTISAAANLKGMAKHTYNRVMSAMAEDNEPSMCHTFAALTDGAKAISLQSGKFSNLYIRGEHKGMAAEEAAKELTERTAACVSRKLRKIDMVCAVAFLAEYISRQRKADEPTTTEPTDNTPATMNANDIPAICPLDFPTALDAYNYALAHQYDANPLAVAIESNNHTAPLLRSLVINGVKVFGIWCDAMDDTATSLLYTTEAGAREAMAQVEANDKEAGVYEPDYYKVIDLSKYFAA